MEIGFVAIAAGIVIFISIVCWLASRMRTCPSDKILVIYGQGAGGARSAKCIHGGSAFVMPIVQDYQYLDLTPISISVDLKNALSKQNIRIDVPSKFTVAVSTEEGVMENAAERLLGLSLAAIQDLAKDIIFGQLRLVIAQMEIEEINANRDKLLLAVSNNVEQELKKIGLKLINVNLTDISDESGYIAALGKEAAAKAINDAKISVAQADREGAIGESNAKKEQRIKVAEAESEAQIGEANAKKEQRIKVAAADSLAIVGENEADAKIAESNATLRERRAEAQRRATTAEKVKSAEILKEAYQAEQEAEIARANKEQATLQADILVKAEIAKREREIQAAADAEQIRIKAKGEADAIFARMEAEARGVQEMLSRQAAGIAQYVQAAGGTSEDALRMMIADKIESLLSTQVEAIKNIKIDKVTVWDGGADNGSSSTANFLSGMMKSVPPMQDIFNMAGLSLPSYLAEKKAPEQIKAPATKTAASAAKIAAPAAKKTEN